MELGAQPRDRAEAGMIWHRGWDLIRPRWLRVLTPAGRRVAASKHATRVCEPEWAHSHTRHQKTIKAP